MRRPGGLSGTYRAWAAAMAPAPAGLGKFAFFCTRPNALTTSLTSDTSTSNKRFMTKRHIEGAR